MTVLGRDTSERLRDCAAVQGFVERVCFKTGPPGLVGTELEWLVAFEDDPTDAVPIPLLRDLLDAAGPPPRGSRVTFEPGGQLELSSPAFRGATACWQALTEDAEHVRRALAAAGLRLLPTAIDPHRAPRRQLVHPRYDAMEAYFAATGADSAEMGPVMMTSTAALQVNLDIGSDLDEAPAPLAAAAHGRPDDGRGVRQLPGARRAGHRLEVRAGSGSGSASTASARRCRAGADPATAWARLRPRRPGDAPQRRDGDDWTVEPGTHVPRLAASDDDARRRHDDLAVHMTTLFPPVRPRGWFEVRYLDAQPWRWWPVPMAVLTALLDDPVAAGGRRGRPAPGWTTGRPPPATGWPRPACRPPRSPASTPRCAALRRERRATPTWSRWSPPSATATSPAAAARPTTPSTDPIGGLVSTLPGTRPDVAGRATALKQYVADELERSRDRSLGLTTGVLDESELLAQHSRLMSPLVWDLAHVGNYEELWLLREAAGVEAMRPELDDIYDAFEHPRATRPTLPLLRPDEAGDYIGLVRRKVLDALDRSARPRRGSASCSTRASCSAWSSSTSTSTTRRCWPPTSCAAATRSSRPPTRCPRPRR